MGSNDDDHAEFETAADEAVALGNRLVEADPDADPWQVASGLLAGAIHFWLYTRQPCADPACEACAEVGTAEQRLAQLFDEARFSAQESDYFHSPNDRNVGRA